ncbi:hypothetical protein WN71_012055 [Streptomyces mangrovisoli]|uniref:Tetratricopeptide repeat protein n=1 Tax=Streptomyces mangrovisoli TaxID=1428628 RepID=A0A1J4NYU1_9ACTN|nr:hypothetical protein WN71_012055 [Streptomyces mangrovisoli]
MRRPALRRVLLGSAAAAAGCGVLGGLMLWLLPPRERPARPPAPAPGAQALTAVTDGLPAALPGLKALIALREARVRAHPADARSWAVLGAAYVERGRRTSEAGAYFPKAENALRASLRARPRGNADALDGLAALANARRDFRSARSYAEAAARLAPKRWTTYPLLIDACDGLGDRKAVARYLGTLTGLHSGPAVQAWTAAVYRDRGQREDAAAALYDAAAGTDSAAERAAYLEQAGDLALERGDRANALRHFDAALRADPDLRAAQAGRARALAALGRSTEAVNAYQAALAGQPTPQYALELGELYESLGRTTQARAEYDALRVRVRQDAAAGIDDALVLGRFAADHGDPNEAVRLLREEWRRQPGVEVADALGWALHRAGDDGQARGFAVIATDKEHAGGVRSALFAYHRGLIEKASGQDAVARRFLQEALRIDPWFSPLRVPAARAALAQLGEPPAVGVPEDDGSS